MIFSKPNPKSHKLQRKILDLEAVIESKDRLLTVAKAEIESMASVIARDRERIKAEGAAYARKRAESEGVTRERDNQSPE